MGEGVSVASVLIGALEALPWEVRACVNYNPGPVRDIDQLVHDLNKNVMRMELLPVPGAIESLHGKLREASEVFGSSHRQGCFKSVWSAKETRERLGVWRRDVKSAFRMTLLVTNLEVALLRINEVRAKKHLQKISGLLLPEAKPTHCKLLWDFHLVADSDQASQTENFFENVLAFQSAHRTLSEDDIQKQSTRIWKVGRKE